MDGTPHAALAEQFAAAINAGDVSGGLDLWSEDAALIAADGELVRGREAIEGALRALVEHGVVLQITLRQTFDAGDVALATGTLTMTGNGYDGAPFRARSDALVVYRRGGDGRWRIALDAPWGLPQPDAG